MNGKTFIERLSSTCSTYCILLANLLIITIYTACSAYSNLANARFETVVTTPNGITQSGDCVGPIWWIIKEIDSSGEIVKVRAFRESLTTPNCIFKLYFPPRGTYKIVSTDGEWGGWVTACDGQVSLTSTLQDPPQIIRFTQGQEGCQKSSSDQLVQPP